MSSTEVYVVSKGRTRVSFTRCTDANLYITATQITIDHFRQRSQLVDPRASPGTVKGHDSFLAQAGEEKDNLPHRMLLFSSHCPS